MGTSIWVQMMVLLLLALGLVHYRNEQLTSIRQQKTATVKSFGRMTASLGSGDAALATLRKPMAEPIPEAHVVTVAANSAPVARSRARGPLNGAYYRVDTQSTDVDYKNVVNRQRMLCESRHQNFWVCEETDGIVAQEGLPPEPAVFCRDCYGHTVPRLLARELGNDTWN